MPKEIEVAVMLDVDKIRRIKIPALAGLPDVIRIGDLVFFRDSALTMLHYGEQRYSPATCLVVPAE